MEKSTSFTCDCGWTHMGLLMGGWDFVCSHCQRVWRLEKTAEDRRWVKLPPGTPINVFAFIRVDKDTTRVERALYRKYPGHDGHAARYLERTGSDMEFSCRCGEALNVTYRELVSA
jgi:hypothetical protein